MNPPTPTDAMSMRDVIILKCVGLGSRVTPIRNSSLELVFKATKSHHGDSEPKQSPAYKRRMLGAKRAPLCARSSIEFILKDYKPLDWSISILSVRSLWVLEVSKSPSKEKKREKHAKTGRPKFSGSGQSTFPSSAPFFLVFSIFLVVCQASSLPAFTIDSCGWKETPSGGDKSKLYRYVRSRRVKASKPVRLIY